MKVSAIIVTNGVTTYLPMTLAALAAQERPPDSVLVFDWSGTDNASEIAGLPDAPAELGYFAVPGSNLGEVVRAGLAAAEVGAGPGAGVGETDAGDWLWILHDDSPPEPGALRALLAEVELSPSVAIAGCKQVGLTGRPLLSVGYTTSRFGRRLTGIEDGEVDQGQHDHRDDVLAVGTAGMLIRLDVWHELGGPDRALGPYMDGQDLSRRARLAGHRTVVVPGAVVRHDRASLALRRAQSTEHGVRASRRAAFYRRRQEFIHFQIVAAPLPLVPFLLLIALGAGLLRAIGRIILKEPAMISSELRAPLSVWAAPVALMRGRAQARRSSRLPRRILRPLQATWREVFTLERDRRQHRAAARKAQVIRDELDIAEQAARAARRRGWLTLTLVAATGLALAVLGPLVTAGQLVGGALAPSQASLGELWQAATGQYVATGFGLEVPANPLLLVLLAPAALGSLFGLNLGAVIAGLLILSIPLAALNAWAAAGAITRAPSVRAWAALMWAAAPALQFALGAGRIGALIVHVFLPLVILGVIRGAGVAATDTVEQRRPEGSVAAAAGGALALAAVLGAAPALTPAALLLLVVAAVLAGRKWARLLLMIAPSLFVIGPLAVFARDNLALLAADPGLPGAGLSAAPAWQMLTGHPTSVVSVPWLTGSSAEILPLALGAVLVVLAALGLSRTQRPGNIARFGWLIAAAGLATAIAQGRIVWINTETAWSGTGVTLMTAGLLGAAIALSAGLQEKLAGQSFGWRQVTAATLAVLATIAPLTLAVNWAWEARSDHSRNQLQASTGPLVPAVVAQSQRSEEHTRALTLEVGSGAGANAGNVLNYSLLNRALADLIDRSVASAGAPQDELDAHLAQVVGQLAATGASTTIEELANLGIADILLLPPPANEVDPRADLIATLDATAGLERVTANHYGILWRINPDTGPISWARIESGNQHTPVPATNQRVETTIPVAAEERTLVLAERASENWRAWLDDEPLRSVTRDDGLQAFELPTTGGEIEVAHRPTQRLPWLISTAAVLAVTALLALPLRRRRGGNR